jgi:FAD/FMN-containing dehydrogenase
MSGLAADLADKLKAIVGERGFVDAPAERAPHEVDWRDQYHGKSALVLKPASTEEVSRVVEKLAAAGVGIVPQGGNTSLCGGSVPDASGRQVVLNLSRMNRVRAVDPENNTMTVEAGCVLANLQAVAEQHDRFFPLSLAAEGSCEIGGNLSTNAGGTGVLRYGNTRDLVLGLEVVLPDGRVWNGLRGLRKDNTGYDLKQLFIGAEGTLGIITAAVLKLYPRPRSRATALVALDDPDSAVKVLTFLRSRCGDRVTGFELMSRVCIELVVRHMPGQQDPFRDPHPWYVLVELSDSSEGNELSQRLEETLSAAAEEGLLRDAVIASSEAQRAALWQIRENIPEAQKIDGVSVKHDVSVPVSRVPELIARAGERLAARFPDVRIIAFGHVGDGNVHYNCSMAEERADRIKQPEARADRIKQPEAQDARAFFAQAPEVNRIVYDVVKDLGGSISAEHGLGVLKRDEIRHYKSAFELELMGRIKQALDPRGVMNPGKVL